MRLSLLLLVALSGCAHQDDWTRRDTIMYTSAVGLVAIDGYTTARIKDDPDLMENGFVASQVLGSNPDTEDVVVYSVTLAATYYLIGRSLPAKWRPYWFGWNIADHGYSVINNCGNGQC